MAVSSSARSLETAVAADLQSRMVLLSGPRQVGKTTLALRLLGTGDRRHPAYLNWDDVRSRPRIRNGEMPPAEPLVVFDEIHKYARWRNLIKGLYDTREPGQSFLVTGSARLEVYRRGGDSLQGRYRAWRLHPLSLAEAGGGRDALDHLLRFGGFPEPFFAASERDWKRWHRERVDLVVREDLRDLERVREVSLVELLADALPGRVGSPLSVKSLREDLEVAHETAERWITILENLQYCFRIPPFGAPRIRAVKKEKKLYLWDWSAITDEGARFENLVASQLLKFCHLQEDAEGHRMELRFLRDTDGREVDFVVLRGGVPLFAVEAKSGEKEVARPLRYFKERTDIPAWYQVHLGSRDFVSNGVRVLPFATFCRELALP